METGRHLIAAKAEPLTQDALLRRGRHDEAVWSVFLRKLLVEAQEVAEAPPDRERLGAEHGQRGLKDGITQAPSFSELRNKREICAMTV